MKIHKLLILKRWITKAIITSIGTLSCGNGFYYFPFPSSGTKLVSARGVFFGSLNGKIIVCLENPLTWPCQKQRNRYEPEFAAILESTELFSGVNRGEPRKCWQLWCTLIAQEANTWAVVLKVKRFSLSCQKSNCCCTVFHLTQIACKLYVSEKFTLA